MKATDAARLPTHLPTRPAATRWWLLLVLSLLLHLLMLAATGGIGMPATMPQAPAVTVVLTGAAFKAAAPAAAERMPDPAAAAAPRAPAPVAPARPARSRRPPGVAAPAPEAVANAYRSDAPAASAGGPAPPEPIPGETPVQQPAATAQAGEVADAPADTPADMQPVLPAPARRRDTAPPSAPATAAETAAPGTAGATPAAARYRVSLPPSVRLSYEVRYATRGSITRGSSTVDWRLDGSGSGNAYAIHGEVSKFGLTLSAFRSEGAIDDAGIAPVLYAEKNARRAETNTHFLRDARQAISFSAATDSLPLQPGAQDRASILWQLAGIARGQRELLVPGAVLDVVVAGVRDAEHWMIEIVGEETISLDTGEAGEIRAWHLVRAPRSGTYDKRIDIWLAPARQWYPVKLRYTEPGGDYLDLTLSALR